jgi:hypothetical protein
MLIVSAGAYFVGKLHAEVQWQDAMLSLARVEQQYAAALKENDRLHASLEFEKAKNKRDAQIKRKAYEEISHSLVTTSKEIASLKENIRFYENIIEGNVKEKGLQIKSVLLLPQSENRTFVYEVVVVNSDFSKRNSRVNLVVEVEGKVDDQLETFTAQQKEALKNISFKYYKRVTGMIELPEDFEPERLHITAKINGKKNAQKEKWYNWRILLDKSVSVRGRQS